MLSAKQNDRSVELKKMLKRNNQQSADPSTDPLKIATFLQ